MNTSFVLCSALLFLLTFLSGYRLHQAGPAPSTFLLTFHKFAALGAGGFLVAAIYPALQAAGFSAYPLDLAGSAAGLFFLAAIASGGLASLAKPVPAGIRLHSILPWLTALCAALTVWRITVL